MNDYNERFIRTYYERLYSFPGFSNEVALFIACQFALESDYGRSNLAVKFNNLCGMKIAKVRPSCNVGYSAEPFASFVNTFGCILDYYTLLVWNHFTKRELLDLDRFTSHLKTSGYCPESDYIDKIYSIYNYYKPLIIDYA